MGAFELDNTVNLTTECRNSGEECIIAQKIFDQCRLQKCLTPAILGPARAAKNVPTCNEMLCEGDIIVPPCNAASVTMKNLKLTKIEILSKKPSTLQSGCWDIELKYVFHYDLEFRKADGSCIGCIAASSVYTLKVTLFGSSESEVTFVSDVYSGNGRIYNNNGCCCDDDDNSVGGPFVSAEGKAIGLDAELKYAGNSCCSCSCNCGCGCGCDCDCDCDDVGFGAPVAVNVTIGLFTIVKIFRTVNMVICSLGNCAPKECACPSSVDPCEFFDRLDFPMDIFAPNPPYTPCCNPGSCSSPDCLDDNNNSCTKNGCCCHKGNRNNGCC